MSLPTNPRKRRGLTYRDPAFFARSQPDIGLRAIDDRKNESFVVEVRADAEPRDDE